MRNGGKEVPHNGEVKRNSIRVHVHADCLRCHFASDDELRISHEIKSVEWLDEANKCFSSGSRSDVERKKNSLERPSARNS